MTPPTPLLEPLSKGEKIIIKRLFKTITPDDDTLAYWKEDGSTLVIYHDGTVILGIDEPIGKHCHAVRAFSVECPHAVAWDLFAEQICQAVKNERWQEVVTMFGFKRLQ